MSEQLLRPLAVNLSLADASAIVDHAIRIGNENGLYPLTVAVLDTGGHLIAFKREDGSGIVRAEVATAKAWGALGMGMASRTMRDKMAERVGFQAALSAISQGRFGAVPGGVLICDSNGTVIGAVGISGDASDKDEYCAIMAVQEAGLLAHPDQPAENWKNAPL